MADDYIEPQAAGLSRIEARLFEHSWDDINAFEQEPIDAAIAAGYSQNDIDAFRGRSGLQNRLSSDLAYRTAADPQFASGLRAPSESIPLTPMDELPSWRIGQLAGKDETYTPRVDPLADYIEPQATEEDYAAHARESYANSLLRGDVQSPRDFAERYSGALWKADPDADPGSLVHHSALLANSLPSDEDFTDQAIALAKSQGVELTPEGVRVIKERVVDTWAESDKSLLEIYREAQLDPEFAQELTAVPPEQPNWLDQFGTGARDMYGGMRRLAVEALPENFISTIDEVNKSIYEATGISQMPLTGAREIEQGRLAMLSEAGDDESWWRFGGQVVATIPIFTTLGLSGGWAMVAAGATGAAAAAAFAPSTAQNYWEEKAKEVTLAAVTGGALGGILFGVGKAIAAMAPEAAAILRRTVASMEEPKIKVLDPGAEIASLEVRSSEALASPAAAERVVATEGAAPVSSVSQFAEDATSVAKMGALARDFEMGAPLPTEAATRGADRMADLSTQVREAADEFHPGFFSRLAAGQDPATVALAEGMDGAQLIGGYLADLGGRLLRDESGALTLFRTAEQKAAAAGKWDARDYVQGLLVKGVGATARAMEGYGAKFDYYRLASGETVNLHKLLNPHMPEWRGELEKGPMGNAMGTVIGDMIRYVEGRTAGYTMKPDNPLAPVADTIREVNITLRGHMEAAQKAGLHNMQSYFDDYFRHIWKDPLAADKVFGVARQGSSASFKERSIPTIEDGLIRGLVPKYENPIELVMFDAAEKTRYLTTLELLGEAQNTKSPLTGNPFVYFSPNAKNPGDVPLNGVGTKKQVATPPTVGAQRALVQARADRDALNAQVQTAGSSNATPALLLQQTAARGRVAAAEKVAAPEVFNQQAWANPAFAKNWNDNIATGFFARDFTGKVFEHINYLKNLQTQGQLIGPMFHARTMAMETIAGGYANVASELISAGTFAVRGAFGDMLKELGRVAADAGKTAAVPYKIADTMMLGAKGFKIYQGRASDPVLDPVIALLTEANARFGKRQDVYRFGRAPTWKETWDRGSAGEEFHEAMKQLLGTSKEPLDYRLFHGATDRLYHFTAHELGRFMNSTTAPLFDYAIPRLKIGVNIERMQTWLRREGATATPEQKIAQARQIVNNTDDRMGEMNMDNIFWPKMMKQTAQLSMISPGWVYGAARFFTNAVGMNMERGKFIPFSEWNEAATTSLIGFTLAYAQFNAISHYLYNGENREWNDPGRLPDFKDMMIGPLTGAVLNGVQERLMQPSQVKEMFDYGKIIVTGIFDIGAVPQEVGHYLAGKMPGIWQILRGMATGEDAIGHKIGATAGGWPAFFLKNLTPIVATSGDQRKQGTGINEWDQFFGSRQVSKFATDPEGFYKGLQYAHDKEQKEEHYRAIAENKIYENQRDVPELPDSMRRGGHGSKSDGLDPDELARRQVTNQRTGRMRPGASESANLPSMFDAYSGRRTRSSAPPPDSRQITAGSTMVRTAPRSAGRRTAPRRRY